MLQAGVARALELIGHEGLAFDVRRMRSHEAVPEHTDTDRQDPTDDTAPYIQQIFVPGVSSSSMVYHHAVEVYESKEKHYVVEWSTDENGELSKGFLKNRDETYQRFRQAKIRSRPFSEFKEAWEKSWRQSGILGKIQVRTYAEQYGYDDALRRINKLFGSDDVLTAEPVAGIYNPFADQQQFYSLMNQNCEHLATFIMTHVHASQQIERVSLALGLGVSPAPPLEQAKKAHDEVFYDPNRPTYGCAL